MRTTHLDQIIRQKEPELRKAVEYLAQGDTAAGLAILQEQGRIREVPNKQERIGEIARSYANSPAGTLIVSPDNASRRQINEAVRAELQQRGMLGRNDQATLYTNSVERLGERVSRSHGKNSALETTQKVGVKPQLINHLASGQGLAV